MLTEFDFVDCHGLGHLCSQHGKPVIPQAGHHARAKTNQPIFGVLSQPIPDEWRSTVDLEANSFFESSNAEWLQAAGARTVSLDYRMDKKSLQKELQNLNGILIPGDTKLNIQDPNFMASVGAVMEWAGDHNNEIEEHMHFPVVGISYGYLAMLHSQDLNDGFFTELRPNQVHQNLQMNLNLKPKETFTYDEVLGEHLERMLDNVTFYNEVDTGITLDTFIHTQQLRHFVPVATFDEGDKFDSRLGEIVSMVEGTYYPFFGFSSRIDKEQFGFHSLNGEGQGKIEHSKLAIEHAQHVANLIVDEARLSGNRYLYTEVEKRRLTSNLESSSYTLPSHTGNEDFYRTEIFLF